MSNLVFKEGKMLNHKGFLRPLNNFFKRSFSVLFFPSSVQMSIHFYLCFLWQLKNLFLIRHKSSFIGSSPQTANLESWLGHDSQPKVLVSVWIYTEVFKRTTKFSRTCNVLIVRESGKIRNMASGFLQMVCPLRDSASRTGSKLFKPQVTPMATVIMITAGSIT